MLNLALETREALIDLLVVEFEPAGGKALMIDLVNACGRALQVRRDIGDEGGNRSLLVKIFDRTKQVGGDEAVGKLVETFYTGLPACATLRAWVAENYPDIAARVPESKYNETDGYRPSPWTRSLQTGLSLANNAMGVAALNLAGYRLRELDRDLDKLHSYKSLHEALHAIQVGPAKLVDDDFLRNGELGHEGVDDERLTALETYVLQIEASASDIAQRLVEEIPEERQSFAEMTPVVLALKDAVAGLQANARDLSPLAKAHGRLRRLVQRRMAALGILLSAKASGIDFGGLMQFFAAAGAVKTDMTGWDDEITAEVAQDRSLGYAAAVGVLAAAIPQLQSLCAQHRAWQEVDDFSAVIETSFLNAELRPSDDGRDLWLELKRNVDVCADLNPQVWNDRLGRQRDELDIVAANTVPMDGARLAAKLRAFIATGRLEFHKVDRQLIGLCGQFEKWSGPLKALLTRAGL